MAERPMGKRLGDDESETGAFYHPTSRFDTVSDGLSEHEENASRPAAPTVGGKGGWQRRPRILSDSGRERNAADQTG
jgi:hypothetical protein